MKPYASVVRPKLMSLPIEASLMIQDITDARPSSTFSPPVSGYFSTADSRLNVFSGRPTHNSRDLKFHTVSSVKDGPLLPCIANDRAEFTKCTSQNKMPDRNISGRHFLFDKRWRNGTYMKHGIEEDVLNNHNPGALSQEFHVYHSHNLTKFAHRKELFPRDTRPRICDSSRSDYLESFPSILLPVTTPSISGRVCLSQNFKNRTRMKNSLFPIDANKTQSYLDPHLGATASFVQRLSEISSLEVETVRQEKMKRLRKINRQDS